MTFEQLHAAHGYSEMHSGLLGNPTKMLQLLLTCVGLLLYKDIQVSSSERHLALACQMPDILPIPVNPFV